jgi:hypothetical protein
MGLIPSHRAAFLGYGDILHAVRTVMFLSKLAQRPTSSHFPVFHTILEMSGHSIYRLATSRKATHRQSVELYSKPFNNQLDNLHRRPFLPS